MQRRFPMLQRRRFLVGRDLDGNELPDVVWYGFELDRPDWGNPSLRTLCFQLDGSEAPSELGPYRIFVVFHADHEMRGVKLPPLPEGRLWRRLLDTSLHGNDDVSEPGTEPILDPQAYYLVNPRSTVVLLGI